MLRARMPARNRPTALPPPIPVGNLTQVHLMLLTPSTLLGCLPVRPLQFPLPLAASLHRIPRRVQLTPQPRVAGGRLPVEASHGVTATPDMSANGQCNETMTVPAAAAAKPSGKKKLKNKARKELASPSLDSGASRGKLHPNAASMLMKTLYTARTASPDLLRAINRLACIKSEWGMDDDIKLHRLMGHIKQSF